MDFTADSDLHLNALERGVLNLLAVPTTPEPPEGSSDSIQVFRAGRNYYTWSILVWASRSLAALTGLLIISIATSRAAFNAGQWIQIAWVVLQVIVWVMFVATLFVTLVARRLNFLLRWYIVTDRSLRIRSGVFRVDELTMTYGNIQEIRVSAGPLQHALQLADVEVQAAGGGGDKHQRGGHVGRFEGLSNANAVRDLIVDRLRHYRDSGLGETAPRVAAADTSELAAARALLDEARALRTVLLRVDPGAPAAR